MQSEGKEERGTSSAAQLDRWVRVNWLGYLFILLEIILIIATAVLFFAELRQEYKWLLESLMILTSIAGILLAWFIDRVDHKVTEGHNHVNLWGDVFRRAVSPIPIALGVATLVTVIALNPDTGYLTYFIGMFGGILVWTISAFFLDEAVYARI